MAQKEGFLAGANGYLTKEAENWGNYYFSINNPRPFIDAPELGAVELKKLHHRAYIRVHLRPGWIWRTIKHLSPGQVLKCAKFYSGCDVG